MYAIGLPVRSLRMASAASTTLRRAPRYEPLIRRHKAGACRTARNRTRMRPGTTHLSRSCHRIGGPGSPFGESETGLRDDAQRAVLAYTPCQLFTGVPKRCQRRARMETKSELGAHPPLITPMKPGDGSWADRSVAVIGTVSTVSSRSPLPTAVGVQRNVRSMMRAAGSNGEPPPPSGRASAARARATATAEARAFGRTLVSGTTPSLIRLCRFAQRGSVRSSLHANRAALGAPRGSGAISSYLLAVKLASPAKHAPVSNLPDGTFRAQSPTI
jgi:hypothetical protein